MIHVHPHPDEDLAQELTAFLSESDIASGVSAEHDPRWLDVLREAMGHHPIALVARDCPDGPIRGYLPLALVKSRLFGRHLVSLPYLNRAGVVAKDPATRAALIDTAVELADQHEVNYLELRHHTVTPEHAALTHSKTDKARMVLDLPADHEALWKSLDAKVRNQVRKGEKAGLSIRWGSLDALEAFYEVFAVNMRDLGTPVYPRDLFASILRRFDDEAEIAVVEHAGEPVAAALLMHVAEGRQRITQVPSASSLRAFNHTNANMWMYHALLNRAIERGSVAFDFGRSTPDSGTWRFKKQWGAQPHPTTWQYHLRRGELDAMRPESPKMQRRIATWQKLPVWVTRWVGPAIVRGIP